MSEQIKAFMVTLDEWTNRRVLDLLDEAYDLGPEDVVNAKDEVRLAIRAKVLESYRNGQARWRNKPSSGP